MNANLSLLGPSMESWSSLSPARIAAELGDLGEPAYRARQLHRFIHASSLISWEAATNLPSRLRKRLSDMRPLRTLSIAGENTSNLDGSRKLLFETADGRLVEGVLMFSRAPNLGRTTICISSQVGCPVACSFCASGLEFGRNLSTPEILDQVAFLSARAQEQRRRVDNVVFMGMGEPFLNYRRVMDAIRQLRNPSGLGIGARHMTVSTVGIVPGIRRFGDEGGEVNLAISLHAPNDELRSRLVPFNRRYGVPELVMAAKEYVDKTRRRVSFEYVLLQKSNDALSLASEVGRLLRPLSPLVHVNLIPWNPFPEAGFRRSTRERAERFAREIQSHGVTTTIRYSKGLDIDAACGQLHRRAQAQALAS